VIEQGDAYYLRSAAFNDLTDVGSVYATAKALVPGITGAAERQVGTFRPLDVDAAAYTDD
jgi:hypothetical protein